jgi:CheY-like chemotaxis protein
MATILVIEDNRQNRYLVTFLLEREGHTVLQATSGLEGVALAEELHPDLILLDIQLPDIEGYAVAERLRQAPTLDDTPIVAVTSFAMVGDRERALAAGCTGYIEKPIDPMTFLDEVAMHLQGGSQETPS